jgi:hypothetical protein
MLEEVRTQIKEGRREIVGKRALNRRQSFEKAVSVVSAHRGEKWVTFRDRRGDPGREMVWWLARRHCGMSLSELGRLAGGVDYAAVGMALKRFEAKLKMESAAWREMQTMEDQLLNVEM